jgi:hypothetical protein
VSEGGYLELCLKFGEPPTEDENLLRYIVVVLQLVAPIIVKLRIAARNVSGRG